MEINNLVLFSFTLFLVLGFVKGFDYSEKELETEESLWDLYRRWRSHHHVAEISRQEKLKRFNVFKFNHEFRSMYAGSKISHHRMLKGERIGSKGFMYANDDNVPDSVDWRKENAVTPVKNQGRCGNTNTFFSSCV